MNRRDAALVILVIWMVLLTVLIFNIRTSIFYTEAELRHDLVIAQGFLEDDFSVLNDRIEDGFDQAADDRLAICKAALEQEDYWICEQKGTSGFTRWR